MKLTSLRLSLLALGLVTSGFAAAETYVVDRYQDDNEKGSLRWAIEPSMAINSPVLSHFVPIIFTEDLIGGNG